MGHQQYFLSQGSRQCRVSQGLMRTNSSTLSLDFHSDSWLQFGRHNHVYAAAIQCQRYCTYCVFSCSLISILVASSMRLLPQKSIAFTEFTTTRLQSQRMHPQSVLSNVGMKMAVNSSYWLWAVHSFFLV